MGDRMLGEEETRWLVVGICLSKVLTPVLRKVTEEEIPQLYEKLIQPPTSINLQTLSSHKKFLPPSTLHLNYRNINNNVTQASPKHYDYSVKDAVSLAKLFVKPPMASFTAFDESLDLSAALSILCGSPNFVFYGVHITASEVRSQVRNEWGHCMFAVWTETYYDNCFQLMEDLVKTLKLPVTSEVKVLEDLKEWKNRGKEMCFGKEVNNDVLKLVKDEMTTLVMSVEENKDTWMQDHEGLKTNLCNLTQLFGLEIERLEAKHTALESSLEGLKEHQAKITESLAGNKIATKSNASLIKEVKGTLEEQQKGLQSRQDVLEKKVTGLAQGVDKLVSKRNLFFKSGLLWKIPLAVLLVFPLVFLYEHYTQGSMLRYWYCNRGCLKGGRTLSFVFTTPDRQTPTVNGVEFSWKELRKKLNLSFDPLNAPGVHYYLNIDRCAYGGVIAVRSSLGSTPQVRGAEVFAVNTECSVFFQEDGSWKLYQSARRIQCMRSNRLMLNRDCCTE